MAFIMSGRPFYLLSTYNCWLWSCGTFWFLLFKPGNTLLCKLW